MGNREYKLGVLDKYPLACMGTLIEDSPVVGVKLDEDVDGDLLYDSLLKTLKLFPLFKTKFIFDKGFKLVENNNDVKIYNIDDNNTTFTWKKENNDYLFKLSYFKNQILLRWCHAITDGRGAERFLGVLLNIYYGIDVDIKEELELGLEPFCDKTVDAFKEKKQESGFGKKGLKINKDFKKRIKCHVLKCNTKDVISLSKRSDASPATIIPPLFSMALRKSMEKKRSVKFGIVVDARTPLNHKTMHNCIFTKEITYVDKFDEFDFEKISTIYRTILFLALNKENVIKTITSFTKDVGFLVNWKTKLFSKLFASLASLFMKNSSTDSTMTYLGKIDYGEIVNSHLKDYIFRSWTDFGYSNLAATDLNGVFTINICEAYQNKDVIKNFIDIAKKNGLIIKEVECFDYNKECL